MRKLIKGLKPVGDDHQKDALQRERERRALGEEGQEEGGCREGEVWWD